MARTKFVMNDTVSTQPVIESRRSSIMPNPVIPTHDVRHVTAVREGRQSGEIWSRAQRALWHEEYDGPVLEPKQLKEKVDGAKKLSEGSKESSAQNDKKVRRGRGKANLSGKGKGTRDREDDAGEDQERLQQRSKAVAAAKKKKSQVRKPK